MDQNHDRDDTNRDDNQNDAGCGASKGRPASKGRAATRAPHLTELWGDRASRRAEEPEVRLLGCRDELARLTGLVSVLSDALRAAIEERPAARGYGALTGHLVACLGELVAEVDDVRAAMDDSESSSENGSEKDSGSGSEGSEPKSDSEPGGA